MGLLKCLIIHQSTHLEVPKITWLADELNMELLGHR